MTIYTLDDFVRINKTMIDRELTSITIGMITDLAALVGAADYIKTPNFPRREKRRRNPEVINVDDWEEIRKFKATEIKKKEGVDMIIDNITQYLNKMTDKTYDEYKLEIIGKIDTLVEENEEVDLDMVRVGTAIFNVASCNKFYSTMYAQLYKDLMNKYEFMYSIFEKNYLDISQEFDSIEIVLSDENYDKFCETNKKNDNRRSLCLFYINLMIKNIIEPIQILDIIKLIQKKITTLLAQDGNKHLAEEYSELLFLFVTKGYKFINSSNEENSSEIRLVMNDISFISECRKQSFPSISNKIIFRHMDILDELENEL
jgi:hypothetical protein